MFLKNYFLNSLTLTSRSTSVKFISFVLICSLLFSIPIGHSSPENFDQPFKYKLLCAGAEFLNQVGHVLEFFNVGVTRLDLTRLSYHYTVGVFNIRYFSFYKLIKAYGHLFFIINYSSIFSIIKYILNSLLTVPA